MNPREQAIELCLQIGHDWGDDYYGVKCTRCGEFYPYGCEPWLPDDEDEFLPTDEDYDIAIRTGECDDD